MPPTKGALSYVWEFLYCWLQTLRLTIAVAGGRGFDQDGNGAIDSTEGSSAVGAKNIVSSRDALRQIAQTGSDGTGGAAGGDG